MYLLGLKPFPLNDTECSTLYFIHEIEECFIIFWIPFILLLDINDNCGFKIKSSCRKTPKIRIYKLTNR